jgi:hypothetical protein
MKIIPKILGFLDPSRLKVDTSPNSRIGIIRRGFGTVDLHPDVAPDFGLLNQPVNGFGFHYVERLSCFVLEWRHLSRNLICL